MEMETTKRSASEDLNVCTDNTVRDIQPLGVLVFERTGYNNDDRAFRGVSA
jgi:hypothetical protein